MGGHRRDQSDSKMPLRHSEVQASFDAQELQVRTGSPIACNGVITSNNLPYTMERSTNSNSMSNHNSSSNTNSKRFRLECFKTLISFLCLMISAFLNFFLLTVVHDIVPKEPLGDLVFYLIDQQRWAWAVGDVLSTVNSCIGFTIVFLHRERLIVLRRVFLIGAILYGLRAVVLGVTFLPPSFTNRDEICLPQLNRTSMYATEIATRFVTYVVTLGLTSGQEQILCGDLMFSGHTTVLTIMYFTQLQYSPRGLVIIRYFSTPITFLGIAALVVSGGHYTMDVLIAYWLTSHVFWGYHQMFELPKHERSRAPMSRLWWFWLCYWFEADVPDGPMSNEWSWPLEKPQILHRLFDCLNSKFCN